MKARALALVVLAIALVHCSKKVDEPNSDFQPSQGTPLPPGPSTLQIDDVKVGTGEAAKSGDKVKVEYTGTLMNGVKFDSSKDHDPPEPFELTLGQGQVIKGWDQGLVGMKVGGERKLTIPSDLAYGDKGQPPTIPPKAGLKFDVELVSIEH
ncbi:MAG: FKBP-type peptidyl-prolyl cis-trans isomerase [Polyangiaceae bacterium]